MPPSSTILAQKPPGSTMTIARFIERDLAQIIAEGSGIPETLTLAGIAEHYGVSPRPVREAVQRLIQKGYVYKQSNGRLSLSSALPITPLGVDSAFAAEAPRDYEAVIADDLIRMSLAGRTGFVRQETMARRHEVDRSVVRRVFSRLAGEGLLEHVPRCGWKLHAFSDDDLAQFLAVRAALEVQALDLARDHLQPEKLNAMLQANSPGPNGETRTNEDLHAYFVEKSKNRHIDRLLNVRSPYHTMLMAWDFVDTDVLSIAAEQHRDILSAALSRDWRRARKSLSAHIRYNSAVFGRIKDSGVLSGYGDDCRLD